MKQVIRVVALIAVLSTLSTGCQKEAYVEPTKAVSNEKETRNVFYSIDGIQGSMILNNDEEWRIFLNRMLAMSEEGHSVRFKLNGAASCTVLSKEVVTYTTSDHDAAFAWADKMAQDGYTVTIDYDDDKGVYNCIAIK